jgi:hypothetical protein
MLNTAKNILNVLDMSKLNFNFFLSGAKEVDSLESGALIYGGATKKGNKIISNVDTGNFISIYDKNILEIYVPSTIDVNKATDNTEVLNMVNTYINMSFDDSIEYMEMTATKGSWYSENKKAVIVEDITIISFRLNREISHHDINLLKTIANYVKSTMKQEGVSISINNALAIV